MRPATAGWTDDPLRHVGVGLVVDTVTQGADLIVAKLEATRVAKSNWIIEHGRGPSFSPLDSLSGTTVLTIGFEMYEPIGAYEEIPIFFLGHCVTFDRKM